MIRIWKSRNSATKKTPNEKKMKPNQKTPKNKKQWEENVFELTAMLLISVLAYCPIRSTLESEFMLVQIIIICFSKSMFLLMIKELPHLDLWMN
jgi:hypothetical protein